MFNKTIISPEGCKACGYYFEPTEHNKGWCARNPTYKNLKSFPFKKRLDCFYLARKYREKIIIDENILDGA